MGFDPTLVRVIATILLVLSGIGILVYTALAIIIPLEDPANANSH